MVKRQVARWALAAALAGVAITGVPGLPDSLAQQVVAQQQQPQPQAAPKPAFPDFKQVVADMQATPGLLTLYRYNPQDPSKDHTKLLAVIPRALLKQDLLLATSISRGQMAGFMWDDCLMRFDIIGRQVVIAVPDSRFVSNPSQPAAEAVERTYPHQILAAMPIVTMAGADPVVDLSALLMGPTVALPVGGSGRSFGTVSAVPRRDLSEYTKVKSFPDNVLIDVNLALATRSGGAQRVGVTYSLRRLPPLGSYQPRLADERVGYFTTVRQDWTMKHSERENVVRYINRWNLKKKDPTLEMSPPEKPIVFVIEKTVPLQWRRFIKEGIEEWNKAYERIGISGAIVVQQQTDDNEFANVDPEDARYNFFRWVVTGNAFAMGPSRADPRTGQLLDADIIFDDAFLRTYFQDYDTLGPASLAAVMGPEISSFLEANPAFLPLEQSPEQVRAARSAGLGELLHDAAGGAAAQSRTSSAARLLPQRFRDHALCNYASGLRQQMSLANLAVTATGKKMPERLMGDLIRQVAAHEVGHTLGLRHNFKASAWLPLEEVKKRRDGGDEPTCASVMDYLPVLLFPGDEVEKLKHLTTPCIGPYDYWAIEHGYRQVGPGDGDEKAMLAKIGAQNTKRELAYATDEDTMGLSSPDPLSNRFDMGADPVAWAAARAALADSLLKDLKKWAIKGNDPNHYLRDTYVTLLYEKAMPATFVSRVVGGQYHHRNRPGDPGARPVLQLVDPKVQRAAIKALASTVFRDDYFLSDPDLLNELGPSRWRDWATPLGSRVDFPAHGLIGTFQAYTLMNLCSPMALQRVYDAELKSKAADKFTAAELINSVRDAIWSDVAIRPDATYTDAKPMVSSIRRNLQKQHLAYLLAIAESEPGSLLSADLQSMVRMSLRELAEQIGSTLGKGRTGGEAGGASRIDFGTRAHLTEARSQILRVLEAPRIRMPSMGGGMVIIGSEAGAPMAEPAGEAAPTLP